MINTGRSTRKIPLSRRSHVIGFQPIGGGSTPHESALERDFVTLTRFIDASAFLTSQPVTLTFEDGGQTRRYTPDYWVERSDTQKELIEIKYEADLQAREDQLRPAFEAARVWAEARGAKFKVFTDREIRGPQLENAKRLLPLRAVPIDHEIVTALLKIIRSLGAPTFGAVVAACPQERAAVLATVWRMIARGLVRVDLATPITNSTRILLL